jgi:hypothetical protein
MPAFSVDKPSEFTREMFDFVGCFCIGFNPKAGYRDT